MKFNFPFAWYNKFGTIPETYKEAMSYEEQILWLCKHQDELQTTITENYSELTSLIENAINELDEAKQDKLIAGENIQIDGNVISSYNGEDLTSQLTLNSYFGDYNVGQTLPSSPIAFEDTASIIILEGASPVTYKIKGNYIVYEIDSSTREILEKDSATLTDSYGTFTTNGNRTLIVEFLATDTYEAKLIKLESQAETQCVITQLTEDVKLTSGSVSFSDGLYYTGSYKLINTNDSTIFPENTLFFYNSTNNEFLKLTNTTFSSQIGSEYWRYLDYSNLWYKLEYKTTGTINSSSTSTQIPTGEAVYTYVSGLPSLPITTLTEDIELNSSSVSLAEGVYNTGSFSVLKYVSDFQTYIAMIPHNTLFYYDESNNDFIMLYDDNVSGWLSEKWTYDSGTSDWVQTLNVISQTISASSQATDIPSALAVYNYIASIPSSPITTLTADLELVNGTPTISEGLYYTGEYSVKNTNSSTMLDEHTLFYYGSQNKLFVRMTTKSITTSAEILIDYWTYNTQFSRWQRNYKQLTPIVSSSSTSGQIPLASAVYSAIQNFVNGNGNTSSVINTIWTGTETEYNNITTPDSNTLYFIEE